MNRYTKAKAVWASGITVGCSDLVFWILAEMKGLNMATIFLLWPHSRISVYDIVLILVTVSVALSIAGQMLADGRPFLFRRNIEKSQNLHRTDGKARILFYFS